MMRISMARVVSLAVLLVGFCTAQSQGNPVVYSSHTATGPVANEFHSAAFSSPPTLNTLLGLCPASPAPCKIVLDPGTGPITVPSTATIGSTTQQVVVEDDGVSLECTGTSGADCIEISPFGNLSCPRTGVGASQSGCLIYSSSAANVTSLVTNTNHTGIAGFSLKGFTLQPSVSATVADATLWLVAIESQGSIQDVQVGGIPPSSGSSGIALLLADGPSTGDNNTLTFTNVGAFCNNYSGCVPISIVSTTASGSGGQNIVFDGGGAADTKGGSGCRNGLGCLVNIDGATGGTSGKVSNITFNNFYLEWSSGASGNAVEINNANAVGFLNVGINGASNTATKPRGIL
jgi:hypothetical protein